MLVRKLFRTLWKYKAQFISMVIMVALGIGVFLGFNVEWYTLEVNIGEIYDATGFADFRIISDSGFSREDLEAVQGIDGVDDATRFLSLNFSVKDNTDTLALPDMTGCHQHKKAQSALIYTPPFIIGIREGSKIRIACQYLVERNCSASVHAAKNS